ncbi:MAG: GDSL-type esterase/lipase family protein [Polyangiaceae bacterium]
MTAAKAPSRLRRLLPFAGGALLVGSLLANVAFYLQGLKIFREMNEVRLDPAGAQVYATESVPALPSGATRVVLFGDSRALMWDTSKLPARFQVINRGVGQQTTAQLLERFEGDVPELHPQVVVLEAGVNDLKAIPVLPERRSEITAATKRNLKQLVDRSLGLGAQVVLVTVFPLGPVPLSRRPLWSDAVAADIADVNRFVNSLSSPSVRVLSADDVLVEDGALRSGFARDMLHLTPAAYQALTERKLLPLLDAPRG